MSRITHYLIWSTKLKQRASSAAYRWPVWWLFLFLKHSTDGHKWRRYLALQISQHSGLAKGCRNAASILYSRMATNHHFYNDIACQQVWCPNTWKTVIICQIRVSTVCKPIRSLAKTEWCIEVRYIVTELALDYSIQVVPLRETALWNRLSVIRHQCLAWLKLIEKESLRIE